MSVAEKKISDDKLIDLVRNSLLVAGQEMGEEGDHWPVIKDTIYKIMKDHEDAKIERNVFEEVRKNYELMLQELIELRNKSPEADKAELESTISELRAIYRACFEEVQNEYIDVNDERIPDHIKRARNIISTLEGDEDENENE